MGTGGVTSGGADAGVVVAGVTAAATIRSGGGAVSVTGQGGGSGASSTNVGVAVEDMATITAGGTGTVTVNGTGGAATGSRNYGVWLTVAGAAITSGGGNVSGTGTAGGGSGAVDVFVDAGTTVSSGGSGNVAINANSLTVSGTASIQGGATGNQIVTIDVRTAGTAIDLGLGTTPGALGLTQPELNRITAGILRVGDLFNTGNITVTAPISAPAGWNTLSLQTGTNGSISQNAGDSLTVANLLAAVAQGVTLIDPGNTVTTLAGASLNSFQFVNAGSLTIGTVDSGLGSGFGVGIMTGGGAVNVTASGAGNLLTVAQPINTEGFGNATGGAVTLTADDMAINAAVNAGTAIVTLEQGGTTAARISLGAGTTANSTGHQRRRTRSGHRRHRCGSAVPTTPATSPSTARHRARRLQHAVAHQRRVDHRCRSYRHDHRHEPRRAGRRRHQPRHEGHRTSPSATRRAATSASTNTGATTLTTVDTLDGYGRQRTGQLRHRHDDIQCRQPVHVRDRLHQRRHD